MRHIFKGLLFSVLSYLSLELPASTSQPITDIVAKVLPATVVIIGEINSFDQYCTTDSSWTEFLRPFYNYWWPSEIGMGSGCIISPEGHIVTNQHVTKDMTRIWAVVYSHDTWQLYPASLLGADERTDLAVLKIEPTEEQVFAYLTFGDSHQLQIGEELICISNPDRWYWTTTTGVVSALDRNYLGNFIEGYIQTDTLTAPGSSGGPLVDREGKLMGIVTMGIPRISATLAIPSHTAQSITRQIIETGKVSRGFLGVECKESPQEILDKRLLVYLLFESHEGARIQKIIPNSPAATAGLECDDLIVQINDIPVRSPASLRNQICILPPDTSINLTVNRKGTTIQVTVLLGSYEARLDCVGCI